MSPENKNDKSFGCVLKDARVGKNISLEEASKHTRIHPNILKAIEGDDLNSLGNVYAKSFLRLYAEYLCVDKEDILHRYKSVAGQDTKTVSRVKIPVEHELKGKGHTFVDQVISLIARGFKKINFQAVFTILVIVLITWGIVSIVKHRRAFPPSPKKMEIKKTPVKKVSGIKKSLPKETVAVQDKADSKAVVPEVLVDKDVAEKIPVVVSREKKIILVIKAKEKSFMQVKSDGKIVFQSVLPKGASESWQAADKIELMLGNAGAVQLELNGKLLQKIGRPGQTLKRVIVTSSGLSIRG